MKEQKPSRCQRAEKEKRPAANSKESSALWAGTVRERNGQLLRPQRSCPSRRSPLLPWVLEEGKRAAFGPSGDSSAGTEYRL